MELTCNIALAPQINLDHALVLRDLVDRALGQHRAFVQARDLDSELAHEGHVVLDHDHGAVAIDLLEEFGGLPRLGVGHAGNRLISRMRSMRLASSSLSRQNKVLRARRSPFSARPILSSTVCMSKTVGFWNLRPMPRSAISVSSR